MEETIPGLNTVLQWKQCAAEMPGTISNIPFVRERRRRRITEKASLSEQTAHLIW